MMHARHGNIDPNPQRRKLSLENASNIFDVLRKILAVKRNKLVRSIANGYENLVAVIAECIGFERRTAKYKM
jgi:hypothetical protein